MLIELCKTIDISKLDEIKTKFCKKPKLLLDQRDNGKEIYQGRNSQVGRALNENMQ